MTYDLHSFDFILPQLRIFKEWKNSDIISAWCPIRGYVTLGKSFWCVHHFQVSLFCKCCCVLLKNLRQQRDLFKWGELVVGDKDHLTVIETSPLTQNTWLRKFKNFYKTYSLLERNQFQRFIEYGHVKIMPGERWSELILERVSSRRIEKRNAQKITEKRDRFGNAIERSITWRLGK